MQNEMIYCRVAPSLGELEGKVEDVWGTFPYNGDTLAPCVFFGLYGLPDFYALWRHKGQRWILWAGSDIKHFEDGYWLDAIGKIRIDNAPIARWIDENCESWCENEVEQKALKRCGISANICPSFLGDVNDYKVEYKYSEKPKVYASVSGDDFKLYRWDGVEKLAEIHPDIEFHLYGNTKPWETTLKNVVVHGRVPKEQMNSEIKHMQAGLRLLKFDGFSEILAKSVLWGQWPISTIEYPFMLSLSEMHRLRALNRPNLEGHDHYLKTLNQYPWNNNL